MSLRLAAVAVVAWLAIACREQERGSPFVAKATRSLTVPIVSDEISVDEPVPGRDPHYLGGAAIASDGTQFRTVYTHRRLAYGPADVRAGRISTSGNPLDLGGVRVAPEAALAPPAVGFGGGAYLTAFAVDDPALGHSVLHARRFDGAGNPLDAQDLQLAPIAAQNVVVTGSGGAFLVAWERAGQVEYVMVTAAGLVGPLVVLADGHRPAVTASPGGGWLIVWSRDDERAFGARIDAAGQAIASRRRRRATSRSGPASAKRSLRASDSTGSCSTPYHSSSPSGPAVRELSRWSGAGRAG
jgi:hypothetical protein